MITSEITESGNGLPGAGGHASGVSAQPAPPTVTDGDMLNALLQTVTDRIYFKDRASRFVRCSREMAALFGFSNPREMVGKTDHDFFAATHADEALADEQRILQTGEPMVGKLEKEVWPDGRVGWALTTKVAHRDASGRIIGTLGISKDISDLKAAEQRVEELNQSLSESSRLASMAEVATGVLHNVGNVVNSVNVSATLVADGIKHSRINMLAKAAALLQGQQGNLADYLQNDPKGKLLPEYLANLAEHLMAEHETLCRELKQLTRYVEHIKEIVAMQQSYARLAGSIEILPATELVEDALHINAAAYERHRIEVVRDYQSAPPVRVDRHKALQVLVNLLSNAKYALDGARSVGKRVTLGVRSSDDAFVQITVTDNGVGIAPDHLSNLFQHGFTTRKEGHGFGLHSGANAALEMGGRLLAHSDGLGAGATFTVELPIAAAVPIPPPSTPAAIPDFSSLERT